MKEDDSSRRFYSKLKLHFPFTQLPSVPLNLPNSRPAPVFRKYLFSLCSAKLHKHNNGGCLNNTNQIAPKSQRHNTKPPSTTRESRETTQLGTIRRRSMGKKESQIGDKEKGKVESVLEILRKQSPLTLKQEKFSNKECVERFLKSRGENVKKAAKQLRSCLQWRDAIGIESLMADEFSTELADGVAYVAGHDDESRPVMVFRIKQDYQKLHSQKLFTRLLVFTMEVAIQTMTKSSSDQFVVLFDARVYRTVGGPAVSDQIAETARTALPRVGFPLSIAQLMPTLLRDVVIMILVKPRNVQGEFDGFFRSASAFMNLLVPALKIMAEFYPGRLSRAFIIDPPSLFSYLWKGVRPFVELSNLTTIVSSSDYDDSTTFGTFPDISISDHHHHRRASSFRFNPSSIKSSTSKIGPSASSRFSFTVSHHFDSLKPWYLSLTDPSSSKVGPTTTTTTPLGPIGPALISPSNARSFSFASPAARSSDRLTRKSFIPSTPMPEKTYNADAAGAKQPRTPRPWFLHSPAEALFGGRKAAAGKGEGFGGYLRFYRRPYDEMVYRAKMKPPLGGLISIVNPHQQLRRRAVSVSQRY
ncbi:hypothetical protein AKJ16_DCAP05831 [Drosera capensis]